MFNTFINILQFSLISFKYLQDIRLNLNGEIKNLLNKLIIFLIFLLKPRKTIDVLVLNISINILSQKRNLSISFRDKQVTQT